MPHQVRTRFAPSPTGYLHIGGARTALFSWLYAKANSGKFILRIEDTDQARSTEESLQMVLSDLKWLGLHWDEGPGIGGECEPYKQSERIKIYKEHADRLLKDQKAYYCFCTEEELTEKKEIAKKEGRAPQYDGKCRNVSLEDAKSRLAKGESAAVRFQIPEVEEYIHKDLVRGEIRFPTNMVGDFIILRSDSMPVYNFCCVVDDALMGMTHVLRAEEHLSNTLRQIMLYEAFKYPVPNIGHVSLILGSDKQKLSKRHGATSVNEYKKLGYLPEAVNNFLALMGWSSPAGQEVMSMAQLIEQFSADRFNPAPAVFDETKMKWMNATHLRALDHKDLWSRLQEFFVSAGMNPSLEETWQSPAWQDKALGLFKTSMETLTDAIALFKPLSETSFVIGNEGKETLSWESSKPVVEQWIELLEANKEEFLSTQDFETLQNSIKDICGVKGKFLFMPIRVAVIGMPHGAELKQLVPLIERKNLIRRAKIALSVCG